MKNILESRRLRPALIAVAGFVLLICFLLLTDPFKSPLVVLLVPFILLFIVLYHAIIFLLETLAPQGFSRHHGKTIAMILGFEPVLLLLLASIDQLTVRDGVLSFILICGLAWYLSRANFRP